MPRGIPIQPDEMQQILDLFNDSRRKGRSLMEAYKIVGAFVERDAKVIAQVIQRLRPTTDLAKMYLRAKGLRMAKRLVAKASPAEIINILERPSIGVLDPVKKIEGGGGGFFLSVNAESCGAVTVGVLGAGTEERKQLPAAEESPFDPFADVIDINQEVTSGENGDAEHGPDEPEQARAETAIERVRRQLAERRQGVGARD